MTTEKQFICECGKTFTNGQSFNGHKSNCKIHHEAKYGSTLVLSTKYEKVAKSVSNFYAEIRESRKQSEQAIWQQAKHTCERCGKVMTEKFGSGRFCSKSCANSRERSKETRAKIGAATSKANLALGIKKTNIDKYNIAPKYCQVCGEKIEYDRRNTDTCLNKTCQITWSKQRAFGKSGGFRLNSHSYGKHGYYKGYRCDSTYELAYIIYNLDHNIYFERNTTGYPYEVAGEQHLYYPDFRLADGSLVEIKGRITDIVYTKLDAVKDAPIKLLSKDDLRYAFDYVKDAYNCKRLEDLYE